jgi:hypothetical protein
MRRRQLVHPRDQPQLILGRQPLIALRRSMLPNRPARPTLRHFVPTLQKDGASRRRVVECGDGTLLVYGRPAPSTADHTQVHLWSDDVERDVREFETRGAIFEDYDFPTLKTVDHVAATPGIGKSAWFKDPDGNTLALFQPE